MSVRPRIHYSDEVCRIGTWQNIVLADVARDIDLEHMQRLGKVHESLAAQYPHGIASLSVVRAGVPVASASARQESARFLKALGDTMQRTVIVLEDHGLLAQMLQTVIRGINVIIRNPKVAILPNVQEAVGSVAPLVQDVPPVQARAELGEAFSSFRDGYASLRKAAASA